MMHKFTIFTMLSVFFLSVPVAPSPLYQARAGTTYYGKGTWYHDGLGACGYTNSDSDSVVALSTEMYGSGGYCGKSVTITNTANEQTASGMVADKCPGCGTDDLDMSLGLFEKLGDTNSGTLSISWYFD